ncbi:uncharacterized protein LOC123528646 [Mercenaria mercenaria]|uniref:uncharacterized protein LOC123528646 n=1 Tax=Mercenaria mercenaria TaxID=6596 RepID=UPI00234F32C1|nr:uncharacterized protein LOC123528646 [Mercenaria mercenaria]XP_053377896.1 uncharacterized protein LOC123528646 [Mercenaria mercenaria]
MLYEHKFSIKALIFSSMSAMGWIKGFFNLFTIGLGVLSPMFCQIDFESSQFHLVRPEARSRVKHGDNLTYMFSIALNLSSPADFMSIFVNGFNLQVFDNSDLLETNFTWQTKDGRTIEKDGASVVAEVIKESELHPVSEIDLQIPLIAGELELRRVTGKLDLHVTDSASLGSMLRPMMYISLFLEDRAFYQSNIFGDYVFMELPDVKVSVPEPRALDMKEKASIMLDVFLPTTPLKPSLLNVYMPKNLSHPYDADSLCFEEPYLTVTDFQFIGYSGLSIGSSGLNSETNPVYLSTSRSSEIDLTAYAVPGFDNNVTILNLSAELDFLLKVESSDFIGSHENMEMKVAHILEFGDHFFIIRNSTLVVNRSLNVERTPKLNFTLDLIETVTENKQTTAEFQLRIWHTQNASWSSAYNVSVLLYLPPFLHGLDMQRTRDVIKANTDVENIVNENCIKFTMQRVSFVHNVRLQFGLILDTAHKQYEQNKEFLVIAEAMYTGWRAPDYIRDMEGFSFTLNVTKEHEITPVCECIEGKFAQCKCSIVTSCEERIDNVSCVDCNYPWHCMRTLSGYGKKSVLKDDNGLSYVCAATKRYRRSLDTVTCTKQYANGIIKRLPPVVGTILGREKDSGYLYGISQNGLAYIISMDGGITWYSIHPKFYGRAQHSPMFEKAILK